MKDTFELGVPKGITWHISRKVNLWSIMVLDNLWVWYNFSPPSEKLIAVENALKCEM